MKRPNFTQGANGEKQVVKKTTKNWWILIGMVTFVVLVNIVIFILDNQEVEIAVLRQHTGQGTLITPESFDKQTMVKKEFKKHGIVEIYEGFSKRSIILWEDKDTIKTAYASHYIRANSPVHWDSMTTEPQKDYAYLYQMEGELLKINLDGGEFGQMLMPGDRINVRASYLEPNYKLPSDSEYAKMLEAGSAGTVSSVSIKRRIFDNATVLDILNKDGESIFDLYYKLLSMSTSAQQKTIKSEEFKKNVQPVNILLNVTAEEADDYMDIVGKSPSYLMTILPRNSENVITEALQQLLK